LVSNLSGSDWGNLGLLLVEHLSDTIDPGGSEALHDSEKKHEVHIEEVVNHIEVGESPVE
jgi:hypothetical protein